MESEGNIIESSKKIKTNPDKVLFVGDTLHDSEIAEIMNVDCVLFKGIIQVKAKKLNRKVIGNLEEIGYRLTRFSLVIFFRWVEFTSKHMVARWMKEIQRMWSKLQARGYELVDSEERADIVPLNTCSVREHAERKL